MKPAKENIFEMLTENTGSHFLDSGGAYGRHWERNQKKSLKDFENEPEVEHEVWDDDVEYTISVFHYLVNQLETDGICGAFNQLPVNDWDSELAYGLSEEGETFLTDLGFEFHSTINTYNGEDFLSQVLQYTHLTLNDEFYVLLQVHQGCDVRGGYTDARLFKLANEYAYDDGYLNPQDVFGAIDGVHVDNMYNGYSLTDEDGVVVPANENSDILLNIMR